MRKRNFKVLLPEMSIFIGLNALFLVFRSFWEKYGFDTDFLILANLFFFLLSLVGFLLQRRGLKSDNPNVFVRGVYSSMILKLFLCIIVVTVYAFFKNRNINRPAVFFSLGLYIVYTSMEVATLMRVAKDKNHVKK